MGQISYFWNRQSLPRKLYLIFGFMALIIFGELLTLRYALRNLGAVRAFVYGESVWSKAQKDSAYFLKRFAITRDPKDFEAYRSALFIPLECRKARLELEKENPDMEIVHRGFVNGKIDPHDVDSILHLIRHYAWLGHIKIALTTWKDADELLQKFEKTAEDFRAEKNPEQANILLTEIDTLNREIGLAEDRFSVALQDGAHWLEGVLLLSLIGIVIVVEVLGFALVFFFGQSLTDSLNALNRRALALGHGEKFEAVPVNSLDEMGDLTRSINKMGFMIEASKEELENRISEAVRTRDEFYGIATHELKTPVTAILLSLQILEKKNTDPELSKYVKNSIDLARRLTVLQDNLMDVTKISAGLLRIVKTNEDLMPIVRRNVDEVMMTEKHPQVEIRGPETLFANVDGICMGQVITNLLKNAIRYGKGQLVEIEVSKKDSEVQIHVRDRGPGIPEEQREKIFQPFTRANADAGISGFGMGLYISQEIMEAHGGTLKIKETGPQGTIFCATFPA
ncbi:MAG: HAMP domain-containing sensor histidine kinase [Bdellovibrionota bacterium]